MRQDIDRLVEAERESGIDMSYSAHELNPETDGHADGVIAADEVIEETRERYISLENPADIDLAIPIQEQIDSGKLRVIKITHRPTKHRVARPGSAGEDQRMEIEVTVDEAIYTAQAMVRYGGSFVEALGKALFHADMENTVKIKQAFPEYWERYKRLSATGDTTEDAKDDGEDYAKDEDTGYRAENDFDQRDHYREM